MTPTMQITTPNIIPSSTTKGSDIGMSKTKEIIWQLPSTKSATFFANYSLDCKGVLLDTVLQLLAKCRYIHKYIKI